MEVVKESKEVKNAPKKEAVTKDQVQEPTYDQLKMYCEQLMGERQRLIQHINKLDGELKVMGGVLAKLPYLFKVLKYKEFFDVGFVNKCVEEIVLIMTSVEVQQKEAEVSVPPTQEDNTEDTPVEEK